MKIGQGHFKNFGSYPELDFDFSNLGLALIAGTTGSGKSTLLDAVAWTLFGITSKEVAADDVKAWDANEETTGAVTLTLPEGKKITVQRTRGKSNQNDLYWTDDDGTAHHGKDLVETQRLLEERMGVSSDLFLIGAYMTQFSKADSFFIAKAKDRREVLEKIADQEFAINLGEKASEARKEAKQEKAKLDVHLSNAMGKVESLQDSVKSLTAAAIKWNQDQDLKIKRLEDKRDTFEEAKVTKVRRLEESASDAELRRTQTIEDLKTQLSLIPVPSLDRVYAAEEKDLKAKITALKSSRCKECGGPLKSDKLEEYQTKLLSISNNRNESSRLRAKRQDLEQNIEVYTSVENPHTREIEDAKAQTDPYGEQIEDALKEVNPFLSKRDEAADALEAAYAKENDLVNQVEVKKALVASLSWLYDKSFELRGLIMSRVVTQIQTMTNGYLEKFFDAQLRITLSLADSDKLDVEIQNNGHLCSFKSLSGGERTILKLAFSLSLMRAAQDKAGINFELLMLDEPLNGLNEELKIKAFGLFQQLEKEYPSVLIIDHGTEFKNQFDKTFMIDKSNGHSELYEQSKDL